VSLNDNQIRQSFDWKYAQEISYIEGKVSNWNSVYSSTKEGLSVVSMVWNARTLLGANLAAALVNSDRATALYEAAFNSGSSSLLINRRLDEATAFSSFTNAQEAQRWIELVTQQSAKINGLISSLPSDKATNVTYSLGRDGDAINYHYYFDNGVQAWGIPGQSQITVQRPGENPAQMGIAGFNPMTLKDEPTNGAAISPPLPDDLNLGLPMPGNGPTWNLDGVKNFFKGIWDALNPVSSAGAATLEGQGMAGPPQVELVPGGAALQWENVDGSQETFTLTSTGRTVTVSVDGEGDKSISSSGVVENCYLDDVGTINVQGVDVGSFMDDGASKTFTLFDSSDIVTLQNGIWIFEGDNPRTYSENRQLLFSDDPTWDVATDWL
jgi:hypothetical protein